MSDRGEDGVTMVEGGAARAAPAPQLDVALSPLRARPGKPLPRERTALAIWFWEIDRVSARGCARARD